MVRSLVLSVLLILRTVKTKLRVRRIQQRNSGMPTKIKVSGNPLYSSQETADPKHQSFTIPFPELQHNYGDSMFTAVIPYASCQYGKLVTQICTPTYRFAIPLLILFPNPSEFVRIFERGAIFKVYTLMPFDSFPNSCL